MNRLVSPRGKVWQSAGTPAVLIFLLTIVAYLPALRGGFIWDDDDHLTRNPAMLSADGLKQIWSSLSVSRYYPLTLTSFWVGHRLWGLHPLPYHAVNIALHALNATLLWGLLRRLQVRGAWIAAAIWALHPVNTETVAWVTELKNTQSGLFFLLALLMFLRFEDRLRPRDYAVALVFGAAAMLSKPSTVVLPAVMLLCAWWRRSRWTRTDFLRVVPLAALGTAMSLVAIVEQRNEIADARKSEWALTAAQRVMLAGRAPWFYAGKVLWPADLCFIYPRWELAAHSVVAWLPLAGLALVAATLWQFRHARWARAATFGLGYFMIALLPVVGFFDVYFFRYSFVTDHFQYLACAGVIALVAGGVTSLCERAGLQAPRMGSAVGAVTLLMLGMLTWQQESNYQDNETLWRRTAADNPEAWLAHAYVGNALWQAGKPADAIREYERALQIKPDYPEVHNNLGMVLARSGREAEAVAHWVEALRISPDYAEPHYNLGNALAAAGNMPEAIKQWRQALQVKPDFIEAHQNLGNALRLAGQVPEAIREYNEALRINPNDAEAHYNLGVALEQAGQRKDAMDQYEQALRIKPDCAEAQNRLAQLRSAP
jgi:tetratricopeptide (TPR) repeat protein